MSGEGGYRARGTNYNPVLFQWPGGIGNNSQHHMLRQVTFNDSQERTVNGSKDWGKFKTARDVEIEKDAMLTKQKPLVMPPASPGSSSTSRSKSSSDHKPRLKVEVKTEPELSKSTREWPSMQQITILRANAKEIAEDVLKANNVELCIDRKRK